MDPRGIFTPLTIYPGAAQWATAEFARFPMRAPRAVALASSACVDKTTKIIIEFTRKDPFLPLKRVN